MTPSERLKEIKINGPVNLHPEEVLWLITRVERLTEACQNAIEDFNSGHYDVRPKLLKALKGEE